MRLKIKIKRNAIAWAKERDLPNGWLRDEIANAGYRIVEHLPATLCDKDGYLGALIVEPIP